ncbi:SDR family NAD(P)-dependent oxidoreductase [Pseudemcibacter aquimaris]|uniref:SDR family NAD(P)-dependent oxidoreductase n=1 Tax=Pseudemcibacter aquimaris TaxID=2857064 RepID=UPI0020138C0A|nr:SDR family NAD(P)-dependent oxidoreductase [Pseudemcibacter aquimaris]MCC3859618.1 SDR family NAD(P)-dependent oxidoreductase [Pseudemcibacter aquimaris]WDU60013.1 SDR family NAD(P)-dependent oxidoreductase [Pseudemcibacter aquimaris]
MTKTVLITGGNRGLGLETVKAMAKDGYKVLLGCRDLETGKEIASQQQGDIFAVKIDLSDSGELRKQAQDILTVHGGIDVLINNGAILTNGTISTASPEDFYQSMQVNLLAPFDLIQVILPHMIKRGYGRIVNVTSDWGSFADGLDGPLSYSVSKAALNALTLNMSSDLPNNVKVNSVNPGWLRTDMGGPSAPLAVEEGVETIKWLATLPDDGPNGGFFNQLKPIAW